jgi:glycosyltransferase involved in cell wall biosynthesis
VKFYKPLDKKSLKVDFGLDPKKRYLLFIAMNATTDKRKGYDYLINALRKLHKEEVELLVVGDSKPLGNEGIGDTIKFFGHISDPKKIREFYNIADAMVIPTLQDNLPNTVLESLACGTPVIGFDVGGIPDMIVHKKNGYLVQYKSVDDLSKGIEWVLFHKKFNELAEEARKYAVKNFSEEVISQQYKTLFEKVRGTVS